MNYKQENLDKLQSMFDKEQNPEELNKIMSIIAEETNNTQLEEEIHQQMNLIKLEDLNVLPIDKISRKLNKKFGKKPLEENNEVGEELNEIESTLVNNVVPKPEEWAESSKRNTQLLRPRYVSAGRITNFSLGFIPRKTTSYEKISLPQLVKRIIF